LPADTPIGYPRRRPPSVSAARKAACQLGREEEELAAFDYFMKIDGMPGESTDATHKGEIDVEAWSWGEGRQTGSAAGRVAMNDFSFTIKLSKASPNLFLACAEGDHIKAAWLTARRAEGKEADYFLKWTFSDLLVSSYETGAASGEPPRDQVSLNFSKIEVEYKEQKADGSFGAGFKAGWDVKTNAKI
jgi:type VI secretion system secreted protein Hcp